MNSNYLKALRIVYFALAIGIALFVLITVLVNKLNGPLAKTDISSAQKAPFIIALIVLTGAVIIVYKLLFPKKLEVIRGLSSLEKKLAAWREIYILQGALIEAPAFFAIVLFMLLGISTLLIWPVAGIILFWMTQPTREKLIKETRLSASEIAEFDSMD